MDKKKHKVATPPFLSHISTSPFLSSILAPMKRKLGAGPKANTTLQRCIKNDDAIWKVCAPPSSLEGDGHPTKKQRPSIIIIRPMPCKTPRNFSKQRVINSTSCTRLDHENNCIIHIATHVLDAAQLETYLAAAVQVRRKSGKSAFGARKPRLEICYSPDGKPYTYSRVAHHTIAYPSHVKTVMKIICAQLAKNYARTAAYTLPSSAVDILYDATFPRGGSIGEHRDDEDPDGWGMVWIYSLGQTRFLRVRKEGDTQFYNVEMGHNSLTVMLGDTFQKLYTHRVDKLSANEPVGARLSLNVRYKKTKNVNQAIKILECV